MFSIHGMTRAHKTLSAVESSTFSLHTPSVCPGLRRRADVAKVAPIVGYCTARPTEKAVGERRSCPRKSGQDRSRFVGRLGQGRPSDGGVQNSVGQTSQRWKPRNVSGPLRGITFGPAGAGWLRVFNADGIGYLRKYRDPAFPGRRGLPVSVGVIWYRRALRPAESMAFPSAFLECHVWPARVNAWAGCDNSCSGTMPAPNESTRVAGLALDSPMYGSDHNGWGSSQPSASPRPW